MTIPTRINGQIIYAEHMNTLRTEILALATTPITVVANHTLEKIYRLVIANPSAQTIHLTLPDPAVNVGRSYHIKALDSGAAWDLTNDIVIVGSVDGGANFTFKENKQSIRLISSGTTWVRV